MIPPAPISTIFDWQWLNWLSRLRDKVLDTDGGQTIDGTLTIGDDLIIATKTPSSASDTGTTGTIAWDSSYIYICTATDTWKRVAIATW